MMNKVVERNKSLINISTLNIADWFINLSLNYSD